jgi:uncharacterized RDD family membrane protein YckC
MGPKLDNRRVLAGIVDVLIVGIGAAVILAAGDALSGGRSGALTAVILGWALYYYFALESGDGQTVGKKLLKLRVVCADGRPAGMREIAVRTILRVVDGFGLYIVGLIVMLVTGEKRQRIGDLAANTIVVDASAPPAAVAPPAVEVEEPAPHVEEPVAEVEEPAAEVEERAAEVEERAAEVEEPAVEVEEPRVEVDEPEVEEPVAETEVEVEEPVAEEPEVEDFEVEPYEVKDFDVEPIDLDSVVPVAEQADEAEGAEEPAADALPSATSPSLEGLAADVAAAQDADGDEEAEGHDDDGPVNVKSVETVSAMDLIMGAADEDAAEPDEDEGPAST